MTETSNSMQCRQRAGDGGSRVGNIERKSFPSRELNASLPLSEPLPNVSGKAAQRMGCAKRLGDTRKRGGTASNYARPCIWDGFFY